MQMRMNSANVVNTTHQEAGATSSSAAASPLSALSMVSLTAGELASGVGYNVLRRHVFTSLHTSLTYVNLRRGERGGSSILSLISILETMT